MSAHQRLTHFSDFPLSRFSDFPAPIFSDLKPILILQEAAKSAELRIKSQCVPVF